MSKNVAIYVRVSTDWQAEQGYSLQSQIDACIARAHELGAQTIKNYVDDGYSGAYLERPALDELREALRSKVYDTVICYDPDRLARNLSHQLIITDDIDCSGAELVFVSVKFERSAEGRLFYAMRGAFSAYEREKIRERTMRGKRSKLKIGKVINDSHVYGYDYDAKSCQYIINPYEAETILKIYHWYLIDRIGGGEAIAEHLSAKHIPSPAGKQQWSPSTVRAILTREMYTGKYYSQKYYHKKIGPKKEIRIPRDKSEWIPMIAPTIITPAMYFDACELMTKKRTYKTWKHNTKIYLLQGLLVCGNCGKKMSVLTSNATNKYYACIAKTHQSTEKACGARYSKVEVVDDMFWNLLFDICKSSQSLTKYIGAEITPPPSSTVDPVKKLEKQLQKIQTEQQAVMNWFSQSLISQAIATEKLSALKSKEDDLTLRLQRISDSIIKKVNTKKICSMIQACPESLEARRNVILSSIDSITFLRTDNNYGSNYELDVKISFK
jgi:site-specific DNA recombinase